MVDRTAGDEQARVRLRALFALGGAAVQAKLEAVDRCHRRHGLHAARDLMVRLGFPTPPSGLIDDDPPDVAVGVLL